MRLLVSFTTGLFFTSALCIPQFKLPQGGPRYLLQQLEYSVAFQGLSQSFEAVESIPEDVWWSRAENLGYKLKLWVDQELASAAKIAGDGVDALKARTADVASSAKQIAAHVSHGDKQEVHDELAKVIEATLVQMRESFPPPEEAQGHNERKELVHQALEMAKEKIVAVLATRTGIDEDTSRRDVGAVCTAIEDVVVLAGDLVEEHPVLAETFVIAGSMLLGALIPEWFILRPLIRLLGFGPIGPVKGSTAAWAQRYFWGAAVSQGSWFSALQRAGMIGIGWLSRIIAALFGGLIAIGSTWQCFGGR